MEVSKVVKRWIFNVVLKSSLTFNIRLTNLLTITLHILSSKDTLQLTFTQKNETLKNKTVNVLQEAVKTVHTSLLLPTTSWRHYYLHTGKVSFEWNPGLNIVHQVIHDLEIFTLFFPHLMMKIKCLSLIFIVCSTSNSRFGYCSYWLFWSKFFNINAQCFVILNVAGSYFSVTM